MAEAGHTISDVSGHRASSRPSSGINARQSCSVGQKARAIRTRGPAIFRGGRPQFIDNTLQKHFAALTNRIQNGIESATASVTQS
jgi:hypothetical protein